MSVAASSSEVSSRKLEQPFKLDRVPPLYLAAIAQLVEDARQFPFNRMFVRTLKPGVHMRMWRDLANTWNIEVEQ